MIGAVDKGGGTNCPYPLKNEYILLAVIRLLPKAIASVTTTKIKFPLAKAPINTAQEKRVKTKLTAISIISSVLFIASKVSGLSNSLDFEVFKLHESV